MPTVTKILGDVVGKLLFREAAIARIREVAPAFRELELVGEALRGASYNAGDKVQIMLGMQARTYTPYGFDAARGALTLLVYAHGDGPGARWGRAAATGDTVRLFGPRGSLPLPSLRGPVVLFGDETSLGVTRALVEHRGAADGVEAVLEVSSPGDTGAAADALGIRPALVARGAGHLAEVERHLREALQRTPGAQLVLTGQAQSIQALRTALKQRPTPHAGQKAKPYWSVGKKGLD
jgi:NADPH-dependent ferric siderophore reductase